jgi:hypothetical protein
VVGSLYRSDFNPRSFYRFTTRSNRVELASPRHGHQRASPFIASTSTSSSSSSAASVAISTSMSLLVAATSVPSPPGSPVPSLAGERQSPPESSSCGGTGSLHGAAAGLFAAATAAASHNWFAGFSGWLERKTSKGIARTSPMQPTFMIQSRSSDVGLTDNVAVFRMA